MNCYVTARIKSFSKAAYRAATAQGVAASATDLVPDFLTDWMFTAYLLAAAHGGRARDGGVTEVSRLPR
jgi:hypothetical protein